MAINVMLMAYRGGVSIINSYAMLSAIGVAALACEKQWPYENQPGENENQLINVAGLAINIWRNQLNSSIGSVMSYPRKQLRRNTEICERS
jgi:hypothetical protein